MEITEISKFLARPSVLKRVCKEWKSKLETNDTTILDNIYKKYSHIKSIYGIAVQAVISRDIETVRQLAYEYTGYLPIVWDRIVDMVIEDFNIPIAKVLYKGSNSDDIKSLVNTKPISCSMYDIAKIRRYDLLLKNFSYEDILYEASTNITSIPYDVHQWIKENISPINNPIYRAILFDDSFYPINAKSYYCETAVYHLDAINLWKKRYTGINLKLARGKILKYFIDTSSDSILFAELDSVDVSFDVLYTIYTSIAEGKYPRTREYIREISMCNNDRNLPVEIMDLFINSESIMKYISNTMFNTECLDQMYDFLEYKNIDPEPYKVYIGNKSITSEFIEKYPIFWWKLLPYAIRHDNRILIGRILSIHKNELKKGSYRYMKNIVNGNPYNKIENENELLVFIKKSMK